MWYWPLTVSVVALLGELSSAIRACQSPCRRCSRSSVPGEVLVLREGSNPIQIFSLNVRLSVSLVPPRIVSGRPVPVHLRSAPSLGPSASCTSGESAAAPPARSSAAPTVKMAVIISVNRRSSSRLSGRTSFRPIPACATVDRPVAPLLHLTHARRRRLVVTLLSKTYRRT